LGTTLAASFFLAFWGRDGDVLTFVVATFLVFLPFFLASASF